MATRGFTATGALNSRTINELCLVFNICCDNLFLQGVLMDLGHLLFQIVFFILGMQLGRIIARALLGGKNDD